MGLYLTLKIDKGELKIDNKNLNCYYILLRNIQYFKI
jgi:hypothetical protein